MAAGHREAARSVLDDGEHGATLDLAGGSSAATAGAAGTGPEAAAVPCCQRSRYEPPMRPIDSPEEPTNLLASLMFGERDE